MPFALHQRLRPRQPAARARRRRSASTPAVMSRKRRQIGRRRRAPPREHGEAAAAAAAASDARGGRAKSGDRTWRATIGCLTRRRQSPSLPRDNGESDLGEAADDLHHDRAGARARRRLGAQRRDRRRHARRRRRKLKAIAGYFAILTTIFLRLIKMIIAPLVFATLVVGIAHMGDTGGARAGRAEGARLVRLRQPGVADARAGAGHICCSRASGSACRFRRRPRRAGIDKSGFDLAEFRHAHRPAIDHRRDGDQRDPARSSSSRSSSASRSPRSASAPRRWSRGARRWSAVMLQITDYVMRFAPIAVFAAVAATLTEHGPSVIARARLLHGQLLSRAGAAVGAADRRSRSCSSGAARCGAGPLHPRAGAARLLDRVVGGRLSAHAGGARPVRRAARGSPASCCRSAIRSTSTGR